MNKNSKTLLRFSGIFGLIGAILGAHMAGSGSYAFRAVHAHILVVGWLTLFGWAVFYKIFQITETIWTKVHVWSAIIGSVGLTIGMWLYFVTLFIYIGGGISLLLSFLLFFLLTLFVKEER